MRIALRSFEEDEALLATGTINFLAASHPCASTNRKTVAAHAFSAKGAAFIPSLRQRPKGLWKRKRQALKARFTCGVCQIE
jgi:hypothetical protein